ncbi:DUF1963 domain-containing protein [Kosakonia sp.]|uniref:DUF1963 domain-containing protein n=1 Tax=Kosakonia sp. TaxID=1916651 RepID=UPI00289B695A|nr:DUF1963 domain-containing protein [Kosakonia sp.]
MSTKITAEIALEQLRENLRPACVATVGGFRPPEDPLTSWFCRGVGLAAEGLPLWQGEPMFPLLQIRVAELPWIPEALSDIALLVLFHNLREHPFDNKHGDGWLIREYKSTDNLSPLPDVAHPYKPFPLRWTLHQDAPGWEDAWDVVDLSAVNADPAATEIFFREFNRYPQTKVGGYPYEIQHGVGLDDFVFQVGSEEKVNWMWADNGIGYFFRSPQGEWRWSCQFY